jgi:hypothetical protein
MAPNQESHYTINNKYRCKIIKHTDHDTILFGGSKRCVILTMHFQEKLAHIDGAGWHAYCNKDGNLAKGYGTIDMIRTCLHFVFKMYGKKIKRVTLVDNSMIECNDKTQVSLTAHYIVKYGYTWYEKHFGATLEDPLEQQKYTRFVESLNASLREPFRKFYDKYIHTAFLKPKHKEWLYHTLEPIYNECYSESKNMHSFLKTVDKSYDCAIFQEWLMNFVQRASGVNMKMVYWTINKGEGGLLNEEIKIYKSNSTFDWSQFGGVPSHILLRHGLPG